MVAASHVSEVRKGAAAASTVWRVTALRVAIVAAILVAWEALAASGRAFAHRRGRW